MPCSVRCRGAAWPPGPACGTPGASGANDVGGRLGTATTGDAFARRLG
ncbi:MAG: hypothetical protein ACN6PP_21900 [Delftia tsuruhatensis]|nr:hypothetical protein [Delftia tsuruhatensis]MCX7504940.1 hypothetical protein [Delftia tsuruhatensis]